MKAPLTFPGELYKGRFIHSALDGPFDSDLISVPGREYMHTYTDPMDKINIEYRRMNALQLNNHLGGCRQMRDETAFRDMIVHSRISSLNRR